MTYYYINATEGSRKDRKCRLARLVFVFQLVVGVGVCTERLVYVIEGPDEGGNARVYIIVVLRT